MYSLALGSRASNLNMIDIEVIAARPYNLFAGSTVGKDGACGTFYIGKRL